MTVKTFKDIKTDANTLYTNIRTIGKNGMTPKKCYYFGESVLHPKKDITKVPIAAAPNPKGKKTGINIKLTKKEYTERINHVNNFIRTKKRMPNFVAIKGVNVNMDIWNAYVGYLCKVQIDKGKLPSAQNIESDIYKTKSKAKKHGHATEHGCDNMGQNNGYYCGCHSLQEVFRNLTGKVIKQSTIAAVCGTTEDGTDHPGLNTCVAWFNKKYGYNLSVKWYNFSDLGWKGIKKIVDSNNQDCIIHNLYRYDPGVTDGTGHYEVINKIYSDYCDVQNSLGSRDCGSCYCGYVEDRSLNTFRTYISGISQKSVMVITNES